MSFRWVIKGFFSRSKGIAKYDFHMASGSGWTNDHGAKSIAKAVFGVPDVCFFVIQNHTGRIGYPIALSWRNRRLSSIQLDSRLEYLDS